MAEQMVVDEAKLQEMIAREVTKILRSGYQDMDEIRKSPAGAIIRIETKIENLQEKVEIIAEKMDRLSDQVETYHAEAKKDNAELRAGIKKDHEALREDNETLRAEMTKNDEALRQDNEALRGEMRTESQNLRNEMATKSHITLIYGLLIALLGFVGTIVVKMFFFTP